MHAAEWAIQATLVTILLAWIGKLHVDLSHMRDRLDEVRGSTLTRKEFDSKLQAYRDETWRQHQAAQESLTQGINRQFDSVLSSLARLEARIDAPRTRD